MRKFTSLFIGAVFLAAFALPAQAELQGFSQERVTVSDLDFPLWYQDANGLKLEACIDLDNPLCLAGIDPEDQTAGFEFLYWSAFAEVFFTAVLGADDPGRARLILDLEGANGDGPVVINVIRPRLRGLQPGGQYTVTHPFGVDVVTADERGRVEDVVIESDGTFAGALNGPIQHFLYWDADLPIIEDGEFFIGDPTFENGHTVFGSPLGTNFFRLEGPGLPEGGVETDLFEIVGKVYFAEGENRPPLANLDVVATRPGEAVTVDVLANDESVGDVPINPTSLEKQGVIAGLIGGTVTPVRQVDNVILQFTPNTGFDARGGFTYRVETFTGSFDTANVAVFVEDLQIAKADYRARTGKWTIEGTSSISDLSVPFVEDEINKTAYVTRLSGAQEMPPVTSAASGLAAVFIPDNPATIDVLVDVEVAPATPITRAHIHLGEVGVNGGRLFDLCGEDGTPACGTLEDFSATLAAADVRAVGDIAAGDFAAAVQAIRDGRTYVNVHTDDFPPGEIRGQLGVNVISLNAGENGPAIGAAEVQEGGTWSFSGKSVGSPGRGPYAIHAESSLGIAETVDLRLR